MIREWGFREFVASVLMTMFAWMLYKNPSDPIIIGALLTAFAAAWGFYLGGSKVGADTATKNADTLSNQAAANSGGEATKDAAEGARAAAEAATDEADAIERRAT